MSGPAASRPRERGHQDRPLLRRALGEVLRRTRLEQGRTLAEVSAIALVSLPYLSEIERGRKEASSEVLAAICEALEVDLADLLTQTGRDMAAGTGAAGAAVFRLGSTGDAPGRTASGPAFRSGDAVCLLAA